MSITSIIASLLKLLENLSGIRKLREERKQDPVQVARQEAQQEATQNDHVEQNLQKAAQGDQAALDELRRAAAE